jgi:hypothetical protein
MAYPPKPEQSTSYTAFEQAQGNGSFPGQELDVDLANVRDSLADVIDFIRLLARSDGRVANGSVTRASLAADVLLGVAPPTTWASGQQYRAGDSVFESNRFYICDQDHVSTVFANDLAAGRWSLLADYADIITEFNSIYLGAKAVEPLVDNLGNPLIDGALYYNTVTARMRVYDSPNWLDVGVNFTQNREVYTATAGQTVFAVAYAAPFVDVWLNGVKLVSGVDFTALNGTSVTLTVGAALNDTVDIIAYGVFTIANTYTQAEVDGFLADKADNTAVATLTGRNLIINGSGRINQRGYVSGTATTGANQFTLDRWFVVTSGQNLAFTGNDSRRVMTAPAGGVRQVVEGSNIVAGDYVLNWFGTASATVNGVARTKGQVFTLTANTNVVVAFSGGTFSDVQLERGTVATPFEWRSIGQELALCQRYYCRVNAEYKHDGNLGGAAVSVGHMWFYPVPMRGAAAVSVVSQSQTNASAIASVADKNASGAYVVWEWTNANTVASRTKAAIIQSDAELTS